MPGPFYCRRKIETVSTVLQLRVLTRTGRRRSNVSDELRKDQDTEVEGHAAHPPQDGVEPNEDDESDFEAHVLHFPTVRMD